MQPNTQLMLGVAFHRAGLEVAEVANENGSSLKVLRRESFPAAVPETSAANGSAPKAKEDELPAWPIDKLKAFRSNRGPVPAILTGLDSADVLCRVVTLPTASESEIHPMLELQLENFSPLPAEQVVYDAEVLRKTDKSTDVLLAIARRDKVQERLELLRQAQLPADVLDVEPLALLSWLQHERVLSIAELDHLALVAIQDNAATLILTHLGKPQYITAVPLHHIVADTVTKTAAAAAALVTAELQLAMAAVEAMLPEAHWPLVRVLQPPAADEVPVFDIRQLGVALAEQLNLPCEPLVLRTPPSIALGFCLRRATHGPAALNLMPSDVLEEKKLVAKRQRTKRLIIAIAAVYVLVVLVVLGFVGWQMNTVGNLEDQLAALKPARDHAKALQNDLKSLQQHVTDINVPLECLAEIVRIKPEGIYLTDLNFTDNDTLTLTGYAPDAKTVSDDFNPKLEKSKWFPGGTKLAPMSNQKVRGNDALRFSIACNLKKPEAATTRGATKRRR